MSKLMLTIIASILILGISLYFYSLETEESKYTPIKNEVVCKEACPIEPSVEAIPNPKEQKVIKLLEENKIVFDYFLNKNHPNKQVYLKLIEDNFLKRSLISKQYLDKQITEREFLNNLAKLINEFRDDAAKLFTDKEFESLFGVSKETDFALTLNISSPSVHILKNISNF